MTRMTFNGAVLFACLAAVPLEAQRPPSDGRLIITVADPSGAVIPAAAVTVTDQSNAPVGNPVTTSAKGVAIVEGLAPGRYTIHAEFAGFEPGLLKDARVRAGDNRHVVIVGFKRVEESVTVARDALLAATDARGFVTSLGRDQIEALSDDPNELAQQLQDLAGGNAIIRVDSFVGGALPPKSQIKSIHIVRDAFAAENHSAEIEEVDIVTQPGSGPIRGGANTRIRDGSMSGRSPFTPTKGPERTQNYEGNVGGSIVPNKSSFSISAGRRNSFDTPNLNVALTTGTVSEVLNLRRPNDNWTVRGLFDYALTRDQTLRLSYYQSKTNRDNLGVGAYDLGERAYATNAHNHELHVQEVGPIGRRMFANTRLQVQWSDSASRSALEAPTIRVFDAFTGGGAQVAGGRHTRDFEAASDLDYIRGQHSVRGGVIIDGTRSRSNDSTNYLGTYSFTSLADYTAGRPASYTRRVGDPLIEYWNVEAGLYVQDDIRLSKSLTVSPGLRYEAQTHVQNGKLGPRIGLSWAPLKSGKTTLRASWGVFYNWLNSGAYEQTLRVDGFRQRDLTVDFPSYPDPGLGGVVPAANRYLLGDEVELPRTRRLSAGFDQTLTRALRLNVTYSLTRGANLFRGENLNVPTNGVRPDLTFKNIVEVVTDSRSHTRQLATTLNVNLAPASRAASQQRLNWRRANVRMSYWLAKAENDTDGAFGVPASGTLATEWGAAPNDRRNRVSLSINSQALRNLSANVSLAANSGTPYTMTTGVDGNGDSIFNDRPAGVDRNTLRIPWQATWSGNFSYSLGFGPRPQASDAAGAGAASSNRYRLSFNVSATNLTNRANYSGFSGVMTSPFFQKATAVANPRKIDIGMNLRF